MDKESPATATALKPPSEEAAARALAEAQARRDEGLVKSARPAEKLGRGGLEPTRYGDWEVKGITSDF